MGGDTYTVNVSRVGLKPDATTGELYLDEHGPRLRALYDLGDPAQSRFMHSTGQSGIPLSPLYRSFVRALGEGGLRAGVAAGRAEQTLVLQPRSERRCGTRRSDLRRTAPCAAACSSTTARRGAPRMKSVAAMKVSSTQGSCRWPVAAHSFW